MNHKYAGCENIVQKLVLTQTVRTGRDSALEATMKETPPSSPPQRQMTLGGTRPCRKVVNKQAMPIIEKHPDGTHDAAD